MNYVYFLLKKIILLSISLYQRIIRPILPHSCRFHPSCSEYTRQSIEKYGPIKGSLQGVKRIFQCHPWNPGGYDPVE